VTKIAPPRSTLTINGERHDVLTEPHRTLLDVLRADLGLTGTKENCLERNAASARSSSRAAR